MALRRQKSRKQQVTDLAFDYLKLKAAGKAAKGAKKTAKGRRSSVPSWDEIMLGSSRQRD